MVHDLEVSRKCYKISRNLGILIDLLFFCQKSMLLVCIRVAFNGNPKDADHVDLKLAPYFLVQKMAPLVEIALLSCATV